MPRQCSECRSDGIKSGSNHEFEMYHGPSSAIPNKKKEIEKQRERERTRERMFVNSENKRKRRFPTPLPCLFTEIVLGVINICNS